MTEQGKSGAIGRFFRTVFVVLTGYFALVGIGVTILGALLAFVLYKHIQGGEGSSASVAAHLKRQSIEHAVLKIKMDRPLTTESLGERDKLWGALFSETLPIPVDELQVALRRAADDPRIHAVYLDVEHASASLSTLTSLRHSLEQFALSQKPIYVHLDEGDSNFYYLASVGQRISLSPVGGLTIPGPAFQLTYFGSALEKLGVQLEVVRAGKYKSAMESFVQDQPSAETLEMYQALEGSLRDTLVSAIAKSRKRSEAEVKSWMKLSFFTSKQALEKGLVDRIGYPKAWEDELKEASKAQQLVELDDYLEATEDLDKPLLAGGDSNIALIEAKGEIVSAASSQARGESIAPEAMIEQLRWAAEDKNIKAVVLRVDSPGGSALASDLIWDEVRKLNETKPVVVSMGAVAASGGYYISAPTRLVYAEPTTITGSIGVIGAIPKGLKLAEKWGVNFHMVTGSDRKDYLNFGTKSSPEDKAILGESIRETYDTFVNKVAEGRKLDPKRVYQIAEGRVYTGAEALTLGLVDRLGGLRDAFQGAKELAALDPKKLYPIVRYQPKAQSLLECLSESSPLQCISELGAGAHLRLKLLQGSPELWQPVRRLTQVLQNDHVLAYWPGYTSLGQPLQGLSGE